MPFELSPNGLLNRHSPSNNWIQASRNCLNSSVMEVSTHGLPDEITPASMLQMRGLVDVLQKLFGNRYQYLRHRHFPSI